MFLDCWRDFIPRDIIHIECILYLVIAFCYRMMKHPYPPCGPMQYDTIQEDEQSLQTRRNLIINVILLRLRMYASASLENIFGGTPIGVGHFTTTAVVSTAASTTTTFQHGTDQIGRTPLMKQERRVHLVLSLNLAAAAIHATVSAMQDDLRAIWWWRDGGTVGLVSMMVFDISVLHT